MSHKLLDSAAPIDLKILFLSYQQMDARSPKLIVSKIHSFAAKKNVNPGKRAPRKQTPADKNQINIVYTVKKPRDGSKIEI